MCWFFHFNKSAYIFFDRVSDKLQQKAAIVSISKWIPDTFWCMSQSLQMHVYMTVWFVWCLRCCLSPIVARIHCALFCTFRFASFLFVFFFAEHISFTHAFPEVGWFRFVSFRFRISIKRDNSWSTVGINLSAIQTKCKRERERSGARASEIEWEMGGRQMWLHLHSSRAYHKN